MVPAVKFCGLTRAVDAERAAELGAAYVGAVLTESPRRLTPGAAAQLYSRARRGGGAAVRAVAVLGAAELARAAAIATEAGADIVQLHGDPSPGVVERVRGEFAGEVWAVVRFGNGSRLDPELLTVVNGLVLDAFHPRLAGGTGTTFDWAEAAGALSQATRPGKIVLAGGLRPSIVGAAIRMVQPDVVDVSSGVESSPGIKDHALMRAFVEAVALSAHP